LRNRRKRRRRSARPPLRARSHQKDLQVLSIRLLESHPKISTLPT
jgi:hypothetical protein